MKVTFTDAFLINSNKSVNKDQRNYSGGYFPSWPENDAS